MTKEERRDYQRRYRAEHKDQIKQSAKNKMLKNFLADLDHLEGRCAYMKDGSVIKL